MRHVRRIFLVALWLAVVSVAVAATLERRSVSEVRHFLMASDKPVVVLDVRTPEEFATGHIQGARLYNYHDEGFERKLSLLPHNAIYVVYCATGYRSIRAARILRKMGNDVVHMDGGIKEWKELKYPVVK